MEEGAPYLTPTDAAWSGVLGVYLTISTEPMQVSIELMPSLRCGNPASQRLQCTA